MNMKCDACAAGDDRSYDCFIYGIKKIINVIYWIICWCVNYFYLNKIIYVYNGLTFKKIRITEEMIGTKFGQYVFTRKFCKHKVKTVTTLKKKIDESKSKSNII